MEQLLNWNYFLWFKWQFKGYQEIAPFLCYVNLSDRTFGMVWIIIVWDDIRTVCCLITVVMRLIRSPESATSSIMSIGTTSLDLNIFFYTMSWWQDLYKGYILDLYSCYYSTHGNPVTALGCLGVLDKTYGMPPVLGCHSMRVLFNVFEDWRGLSYTRIVINQRLIQAKNIYVPVCYTCIYRRSATISWENLPALDWKDMNNEHSSFKLYSYCPIPPVHDLFLPLLSITNLQEKPLNSHDRNSDIIDLGYWVVTCFTWSDTCIIISG